jgi:alkylation response protein AidB-like acyl-CoA dehydrogenase
MSNLNSILEVANQHAMNVIKPNVDQWVEQAKWPLDASQKAGEVGLLGLYCPEELGGQGLSLGEGIQVYEQLGLADGAYAFALSMHNICSYAICGYATDEFKGEWARDLIAGKKLANFALTEPQSGSDPVNMYTTAKENSDGTYTLNGAKAWVSLADVADVYLVVAKTSEQKGHKDMAMFAIPKDSEGLSFGPMYQTPSYSFLPMSEMYIENVTIPKENIILPVGMGLQGSLMAIDIARVSIASGCCGLMQTALDTALRYARDRKMFSKTNLQLDGIQWMLGEVDTNLELSRLIYKKAANALGTPEGSLLAAKAKLFVPDAALKAANVCTQVLGGMGLLKEYGLDRLSRLAQMLKIVDGTTEIQRVVIGRALQKRAESLEPITIPKGFGEK